MKGQKMSTDTTVENVVSDESVNADSAPETPDEATVEQRLAEMDDANPYKGMIVAGRNILLASREKINSLVGKLKQGTESVENQISDLIEDSEDEEIVKLRTNREKLEQALEDVNTKLRDNILAANPEIHPMTEDEAKAIRDDVTKMRSDFRSAVTATEKMLRTMMSEAEAKFWFSDIAQPLSVSGGAVSTGAKKYRFDTATVDGENVPGTAGKNGKENVSAGSIAEFISSKFDLTAPGNRVKTSDITTYVRDNGFEENGEATFSFPVEQSGKTVEIHVTQRATK